MTRLMAQKTTSNSLTYSEMTIVTLLLKKMNKMKTKNNISASMSLAEEIKKDIDLFKKLMLENKTLGWKEKNWRKKFWIIKKNLLIKFKKLKNKIHKTLKHKKNSI